MKRVPRALFPAIFAAVLLAAPLALRADRGFRRCAAGPARAALGDLAVESKSCLGCHDGALAPNVLRQREGVRVTGVLGRHPVGVSYRAAWRARRGRVRSPGMLDHRLRLPGGKVECETCHRLTEDGRVVLTVPMDGERLCLSCHET